jgi:hypothetical protein
MRDGWCGGEGRVSQCELLRFAGHLQGASQERSAHSEPHRMKLVEQRLQGWDQAGSFGVEEQANGAGVGKAAGACLTPTGPLIDDQERAKLAGKHQRLRLPRIQDQTQLNDLGTVPDVVHLNLGWQRLSQAWAALEDLTKNGAWVRDLPDHPYQERELSDAFEGDQRAGVGYDDHRGWSERASAEAWRSSNSSSGVWSRYGTPNRPSKARKSSLVPPRSSAARPDEMVPCRKSSIARVSRIRAER